MRSNLWHRFVIDECEQPVQWTIAMVIIESVDSSDARLFAAGTRWKAVGTDDAENRALDYNGPFVFIEGLLRLCEYIRSSNLERWHVSSNVRLFNRPPLLFHGRSVSTLTRRSGWIFTGCTASTWMFNKNGRNCMQFAAICTTDSVDCDASKCKESLPHCGRPFGKPSGRHVN